MENRWLLLFFILLTTGCAKLGYNPHASLDGHLNNYQLETPATHSNFFICTHYDCDVPVRVTLSQAEWLLISELFAPPATSPAQERVQIAKAIGQLEKLVGTKNNTFADQPCNNYQPPVESIQLDCVSESLNTTVYLLLLENMQLLTWHHVRYPAHRSIFQLSAPHFSATIQDPESQQLFAVDSWFHANGEAAEIVPIAEWWRGYTPQNYCGAGQVTP